MKLIDHLVRKRTQLQWAALLIIAVVLPTIALLWFMSRVVENERLVVRQKLAALYQDKLTEANARISQTISNHLALLDKTPATPNPYPLLRRLVLEKQGLGLVVWDSRGTLVYPQPADISGEPQSAGNPLGGAWEQEFGRSQYAEAARLYAAAIFDPNPRTAIAARLGQSRCLAKLNRWDEALESCEKAAFSVATQEEDAPARLAVENARLMLLSLISRSGQSGARSKLVKDTLYVMDKDLFDDKPGHVMLTAGDNHFIARKLLDQMRENFTLTNTITERLQKLVSAEECSMAAAEKHHLSAASSELLVPVELNGLKTIGLWHKMASGTVLAIYGTNETAVILSGYRDVFGQSGVAFRISDANGLTLMEQGTPQGHSFTTASLPDPFPGWKVELYFVGGDVFDKAASRQIAIYVWTGILVIVLILAAGVVAFFMIGRQIRLNRMKNDFIATVSHELKTPLASMRVLVDTLLEGNIRDESQAREYLQMTARENERLSRMIDNFLTFSRMERNKIAFAMSAAQPAAIVNDAAEAVKAKFAARHCRFTIQVPSDLPEIEADHDAMVTVIVNLLDNACKYTGDDKQIQLSTQARDGFVCFAVSDNGIGLARRHQRKIFERFYQVDNSLARRAEGCGLGLSIVKFIVDAHNGKIIVTSELGRGSTFTVRLPARQNT